MASLLTEWDWRFGSFEAAIALIEKFAWDLTIAEADGRWYVHQGETLLLETDTKDEVRILLYGMGLAYDAIPEQFFDSLVENIAVWKKTL
jgi:hypothetical protein